MPVAPDELVERLRKPTSSHAGPQTLPPSRVEWIAEQIGAATDLGADVFEGYDDGFIVEEYSPPPQSGDGPRDQGAVSVATASL